jgi:hypothetical protein
MQMIADKPQLIMELGLTIRVGAVLLSNGVKRFRRWSNLGSWHALVTHERAKMEAP